MAEPADFLFKRRRRDLFEMHFSPEKEDFDGLYTQSRSSLELRLLFIDSHLEGLSEDIGGRQAYYRIRTDNSVDLFLQTDLRSPGKECATYLSLADSDALETFVDDFHDWESACSEHRGLDKTKLNDVIILNQKISGSPFILPGALAALYGVSAAIVVNNDSHHVKEFVQQHPYCSFFALLGLAGSVVASYFVSKGSKRNIIKEEAAKNESKYQEIEKRYHLLDQLFTQNYLDKAVYGKQALELALTPLK